MIKLVAFDLDGTLTQHKTPLSAENRAVLDRLAEKYSLVMVGAGQCMRIFNQMNQYPIDVIGNYGLQYAKYNPESKNLEIHAAGCNCHCFGGRIGAGNHGIPDFYIRGFQRVYRW